MIHHNTVRPAADTAAISLSLFCALHCLFFPLAVSLYPSVVLTGLQDERVHLALLVFVIPISVFSLTMGCKKHRQTLIVGMGLAGILLLVISALFGDDLGGSSLEITGTLLGSIIIASSHVLNFKLCRSSHACLENHDC
ncbi:MAG: MerC domain-containing protein [Luminiphilus sp.]|nr:MerC domain-containing protein [Luminiphilus sp.]